MNHKIKTIISFFGAYIGLTAQKTRIAVIPFFILSQVSCTEGDWAAIGQGTAQALNNTYSSGGGASNYSYGSSPTYTPAPPSYAPTSPSYTAYSNPYSASETSTGYQEISSRGHCSFCKGSGTCGICGGSGWISEEQGIKCTMCYGSKSCNFCKGTGRE